MGNPPGLIVLIDPLPEECELLTEIFDAVGLQTAIVPARSAAQAADGVAALSAAAVVYRTGPNHRGGTFMRALRQRPSTATTPVLILTTDPHRASHDEVLAAGASEVLMLPVHPFEISTAVMRLVSNSAHPLVPPLS